MVDFEVIEDAERWFDTLEAFKQWDFFHSFEFHSACLDSIENTPWMIVLKQAGKPVFALPMIRREISNGQFDLVSVYGYTGPLCHNLDDLNQYLDQVKKELRGLGCVSLFCRLHPILHAGLKSEDGFIAAGKTVAIHCHDDRLDSYRKTTRYEIRKLIRSGATVTFGTKPESIDTFAEIYDETMRSLNADEFYFFEREFLDSLFQIQNVKTVIGSVWFEGEVISSGIFTSVNGIAQYFLGGARQAFQKLAPQKFLLHEAAGWASQQGAAMLHLGGGRGAKEDGLFRFKTGFSKGTLDFRLLRIVLNEQHYQELLENHAVKVDCSANDLRSQGYFPAYRAPVKTDRNAGADD